MLQNASIFAQELKGNLGRNCDMETILRYLRLAKSTFLCGTFHVTSCMLHETLLQLGNVVQECDVHTSSYLLSHRHPLSFQFSALYLGYNFN